METVYDVAVVGGGINGCGVASDAALRGLSVFLCEQDDLASKTSSSSTKLIHGGLRYLEHLDFNMVKKALDERQLLLELAPHLVKPLGLVLPHKKGMRPLWMLRMGLFLYDHLSRKNKLPKSRLIRREKDANYFNPLIDKISKGFLYYDCSTNDARLTIANAMQAKKHGADIRPRTKLISATTENKQWILTLKPQIGKPYEIRAKALINAAGPWVEPVNQIVSIPMHHKMALIKGSHLVVKKLYEGEQAYLLQHSDKRVVFTIPYYGYTMIGTTDIELNEDLNAIKVSASEINYLLDLVNTYFKTKVSPSNIIHSWSGVRPLIQAEDKTPEALSRDYTYAFTEQPAPAVSIYGGKITTFRQLAVEVIDQLQGVFPNLAKSITASTPLPGAFAGAMPLSQYKAHISETYPWVDKSTLNRYLTLYGTRAQEILKGKQQMKDLGQKFADGVYQAEIDYLIQHEWAQTLDDILWRRTKLGLTLDDLSRQKIKNYLSSQAA